MSGNITDRRYLLLGANGLLGRAFSNWFSLGNCKPRSTLIALDRAACDITNAAQIAEVFAEHRPTIVINCAAYTKVDQAERDFDLARAINTTGPANLAHACKSTGSLLVSFSTDFVFDGTSEVPYQPADATNPLSVYGKTKRDGEREIESINPPGWLIVRTSWLFGHTGPCFPRTILERAAAGLTLSIVDDQFGCPTYAPDLADAISNLIDAGAAGIHHVTNRDACSWFEFAATLLKEFDLPAERMQPISTAKFLQMRPAQAIRPKFSVMGDERLPKLIGREMRSWREAIRDFRKVFAVGNLR